MKRAAALFAAVWLAFAPVPTAASDLARMAPIIDVQGLIEGDVTLAGGQISIEAEIAGDLVATGGSIGIGAATSVKRNVFLFGFDIAMAGRYAQRVWLAGDTVVIDLVSAGDVSVAASRVIVGPNTRIAGKLKVWALDPPEIHANAQLSQGLVYDAGGAGNAIDALLGFVGTVLRFAFNIAVWGSALLLAALAPGYMGACAEAVRTKIGSVLLWGLGIAVVGPFAVLLSAVTLVGLPLAGALILALALALGLGYAVAAAFAGGLVLRLVRRDWTAPWLWRIAAIFAGLVMLAGLRHIPGAAALVLALAFVLGSGAACRELYLRMR
jgi:hypothetical protein